MDLRLSVPGGRQLARSVNCSVPHTYNHAWSMIGAHKFCRVNEECPYRTGHTVTHAWYLEKLRVVEMGDLPEVPLFSHGFEQAL